MATFFLSPWSARLLSVLRIVSGLLMLFHGSQKLFNWPLPTTVAALAA
ncbi:hypothetical protein MUN84_21610 [Hymenobacter sp. 5516J-16]|nr:hypothetical protein [Hymenobacter sp. 5516J-16]UOQ77027.1 hypothetical protein MUN84_21610 [Hymenobacter sp. 5516J-16]